MPTSPRVIVITGASSGIGLAAALVAAERGHHLVLVARGAQPLETAAAQCDTAGAASTMVVPTDVGDDGAVEKLVHDVLGRHGRLDAVINAAGVVAYGRTEEVPAEVFDGVIRTNLTGSVNVARHVVPVLRDQGRGTLVLVGSVIGHIGVPAMTPYVLSKYGVRALARQLQLENRDVSDVEVVYVAPGGVNTPIYQQAANYAGYVGRPPPPVHDPTTTGRQLIDRLEHPGRRSQLTVANDLMRFGFSALPWVYDAVVGPLFPVGATDLTRPTEGTTGNVLESREDGNALRADPGNALVGIARNVLTKVRG